MTVTTNTSFNGGDGINMRNAKVTLMDVALNHCQDAGLRIPDSSSVVATRCEFANSQFGAVVHGSGSSARFNNCTFHGNGLTGLAGKDSTIHIYGEATAIHLNKYGIVASTSGKVIIHLPSHHNTTYNNGQDRITSSRGTITNVED